MKSHIIGYVASSDMVDVQFETTTVTRSISVKLIKFKSVRSARYN
jgi:hypothetical protein